MRTNLQIQMQLHSSALPQAKWDVDEKGEPAVVEAGVLLEIRHGHARQRAGQGHKYAMLSARFSSDGLFLVTCSSDKSVRIFLTTTGKEVSCFDHEDWCRSACFSLDGIKLCTACDDRVARIWRWEAKLVEREFRHRQPIWFVDFSPNGEMLATVSKNQQVMIHDLVENTESKKLQHEDQVFMAVFSPNNLKICTASGWDWGHALVWDIELGEIVFSLEHRNWVLSVCWSPGGNRVLTTCRDKMVRVWDVEEREEADADGNIVKHEGTMCMFFEQSNWPNSAEFSPDGKRVCIACDDGTARVIELSEGWELCCFEEDAPIIRIAYAPDARRFCTASADGVARIYGGLHLFQKPVFDEEDKPPSRMNRATIMTGADLYDPAPDPIDEEAAAEAEEAEKRRRSQFLIDDDDD